jgi:hypothetical protein
MMTDENFGELGFFMTGLWLLKVSQSAHKT